MKTGHWGKALGGLISGGLVNRAVDSIFAVAAPILLAGCVFRLFGDN